MANGFKTQKEAIRSVFEELIQAGDTEFLQFVIRHNQMFPEFREVLDEFVNEHQLTRAATTETVERVRK